MVDVKEMERLRSRQHRKEDSTMRQILAVAFLGMSLAFTASAALAGENSTLPSQLQGHEVVMVGTGSGSPTAVDTDQFRPTVYERGDRQ